MINGINLEKINQAFRCNIQDERDIFLMKRNINYKNFTNDILTCRQAELNFILYDEENETFQPEIAEYLDKEDDFLISMKYHPLKQGGMISEEIKFNCTHAQAIIKTDDDNIFCINTPQNYMDSIIGTVKYPAIFFRPKFPKNITEEKAKAYMRNIRSWLLLINTYSKFPGNYNGGDAINGCNIEQIKNYGILLLSAANGDNAAKILLEQQKVYCAELIYLALNLGLHFPLSDQYIEKLSLEDTINLNYLSKLDYSSLNENYYINGLSFLKADNSLKAVDSDLLAVKPLTFIDLLLNYIKFSVNREKYGESCNIHQHRLLNKTITQLRTEPGYDQLINRYNGLIEEVQAVILEDHVSYENFNKKIEQKISRINNAMSLNSESLFIPPHSFLLSCVLENDKRSFLDFEYVGHALHQKFFI